MDHGPRINFAISAHGFGHLTQSIAVARALLQSNPDIQLRFQCNLPRRVIADRLGNDEFEHDQRSFDIGLIQPDPLQCDLEQTAIAYAGLHANFRDKVNTEGRNLADWGTDILVADIPYLSIAAAAVAGIESIAIASLSWDRVLASYYDLDAKGPKSWQADILSAYAETSMALLPEPALPGDCFPSTRPIPPIAISGNPLPQLRGLLLIADDDQRPLIVCSLGGISANNLPLIQMQQDPRFHWLINAEQIPSGDHMHSMASVNDLRYQDILASADGLVSKPGYGTAVEAAVNQLPFVYTSRGNFPDETVIMQWLLDKGRSQHISQQSWLAGDFGDYLEQLSDQAVKPPVIANGAEVAACIIQDYLGQR